MNIQDADNVEHKVEDEWHYKIMTKNDWKPKSSTRKGLVRFYTYFHETIPNKIRACTGYSSDYWVDDTTNKQGFWRELEPYLKSLEVRNETSI